METGKAKPRRGRRRRQGITEKSLPQNIDKNLASLLSMLLRATLQNQQRVRLLSAAILDTWLVPKDHPVAAAVAEETARFAQDVRTYREAMADEMTDSTPPGSPVATLFMAFPEALAAADKGARRKDAVGKILSGIEAMGDGARTLRIA